MNYFAHGFRFVDRPVFLTGTAVPDWLSVVNRRLRFRPSHLSGPENGRDGPIQELAQGIAQHLEDDARFHNHLAFSQSLIAVLHAIRPHLNSDGRHPPVFLSHLLVELLFDASLVERAPKQAERYYEALEKVPPELTEEAVSALLGQPVAGLAEFIRLFCRERILFDYNRPDSMLWRINQVMRRLRLPALPPDFAAAIVDAQTALRPYVNALLDSVAYPTETLLTGLE